MSVDSIVTNLTLRMKRFDHCLYLDNFYTTLTNVKSAVADGIFVTGTCRINRKGLPKNLILSVQSKLMKGQMILINDGVINIILLQERKLVILLSTSNSVRENEYNDTGSSIITDETNYRILEKIKTPKFIDDYNQNMRLLTFCIKRLV
ncbi:PiggyBac transposable element-derived protein 4, partial [Cucumispora dikerogammari]